MMFSAEPIFGSHFPFPDFEDQNPYNGNDLLELWSQIQPEFPNSTHSPCGSETSQTGVAGLFPAHSHSSTSGSDANRSVYSVEERKRRRKISNRLSARRSRMKKKQQEMELTTEINQLSDVNRELQHLLSLITQRNHSAQIESAQLMAELFDLKYELDGLTRILCSNETCNISNNILH